MFRKICLLVWMDECGSFNHADPPQKWNKSEYFWHYFCLNPSFHLRSPFEAFLSYPRTSWDAFFTRNLMPSLFDESMYSNKSRRRIFLWSKLMPSCPMCVPSTLSHSIWSQRDIRLMFPETKVYDICFIILIKSIQPFPASSALTAIQQTNTKVLHKAFLSQWETMLLCFIHGLAETMCE